MACLQIKLFNCVLPYLSTLENAIVFNTNVQVYIEALESIRIVSK